MSVNTETSSILKEFSDKNPDGSRVGQSSSDLVGFFGATPVVQPTSTTDIRTALINLGLLASGGASPLNLNGGAFTAGSVAVADGGYIAGGTSSGLTIGTATTQKLGFLGATPVARTTFANAVLDTTVAVSVTNGGVTSWGFASSTQANAIIALTNELRALMVAFGLGA